MKLKKTKNKEHRSGDTKMNPVKKVLIVGAGCAGAFGLLVGGMVIVRNASRGEVNAYLAQNFAMTDYWGDASQTYGMVTTEGIQQVMVSDSQTVTEVFVKEGDTVKKGDKLLTYDTTLSALEVTRAEISLKKQEQLLKTAQADLAAIRKMRPTSGTASGTYRPAKPTTTTTTTTTVDTTTTTTTVGNKPATNPEDKRTVSKPTYISGKGTAADPYIFLCPEDWVWKQEDLQGFYTGEAIGDAVLKKTNTLNSGLELLADDEETPETPGEETPGEETPGENQPEQPGEDQPDKPGEGEDTPDTPGEGEDTPDTPGEGEDTPENPEKPEKGEPVFVALIVREKNCYGGAMKLATGLRLVPRGEEVTFTLFDPGLQDTVKDITTEVKKETTTKKDVTVDPGESGYIPSYTDPVTAQDIAKMRYDKEIEIRDLELAIKMAKVEVAQKKKEVSDGAVFATVDGYVKAVRDADEAYQNGDAVVEVSSGGGYYIEGYMTELDFGLVNIGDTVQVNSWESGTSCEGTITEISNYPSESGSSWSDGNNNVSYYPFRVFVDEEANLREYENVDMQYTPQAANPDAWYLESMFIRSEKGQNYVYVMNEKGRLEKQPVQVGRNLWGSYTQINGGITSEDYIAFPYGDAANGAKARVAEQDEFYQGW